jgi:ElaB/YqjD/DUF883 family membrane-anchored ribosome-binding protein
VSLPANFQFPNSSFSNIPSTFNISTNSPWMLIRHKFPVDLRGIRMADFDYKLNLTPQPIKPEPDPLPTGLPESSSTSTFEVGSGSEGPVPVERLRSSSEDVHDAAQRIADQAREKLHDAADEARVRMNEVADRASKLADQAKHRLHDARIRFNERLPIWKQQAREHAHDARIVARHTAIRADENARRYPIETIAAAAGAGFLIGATMRIWRSSRG